MSNQAIKSVIRYPGDADHLVQCLAAAGFLDVHPLHRYVVHNWHKRCDDTLDARLFRQGERYACGTIPRGTKIGAKEKEELFERHFRQTPRDLFTVAAMPAGNSGTDTDRSQSIGTDTRRAQATGTYGPAPVAPPGNLVPFAPALGGAAKRLPVPVPEPVPEPAPAPKSDPPTPAGGGTSQDDANRFSAMKAELKRQFQDVPLGLERHRFVPLRSGGNDYDDCFRSVVLVHRSRAPDATVLCLASDEPELTRAGCDKYAGRLERLACQAFNLPKGSKVRFVVRDG